MGGNILFPPKKGAKRGITYQIYDAITGVVICDKMPNGSFIANPIEANRLCKKLGIEINDFKRFKYRITPVAK